MAGAPYFNAAPMQQAFTGGEISPLMSARPEQARYQTGCRKLHNMVCIPQGAAMRRSGLQFLGLTAAQPTAEHDATAPRAPVRLIPFVYSLTQTRVLEFGDGYMRVWRGDVLLSMPGDALTPYQITTPYTATDVADLRVAQIADVLYVVHHNHRPRKISRYGDTDWRLQQVSFMPHIMPPISVSLEYIQTATPPDGRRDYTYVVTAISSDGGEESIASASATINTPPLTDQNFVRVHWSPVVGAGEYRIYKKQSGVMGFVGRVPQKDVTMSDEDRADFEELQALLAAVRSDVEYQNELLATEKTSLERVRQFASEAGCNARSLEMPETRGMNLICVTLNVQMNEINARIEGIKQTITNLTNRRNELQATYNNQFGWVYVQNQWDDYNILPDMADPPPGAKDPFVGAGNYPRIVFAWQQRLGFAATLNKPLTVWLSPIGVFESMAASVPPGEADAIEFTISGEQQHGIQWVAGEKALLIGTEGSIVSVNSGTEKRALTPKQIDLGTEQFYGSSFVSALPAGGSILMAHASGCSVREITYNFSADGYQSPDLTLLSEHIFTGRRIMRMAWQQMPWAILYCLLDDGTLASCTYLREHDIVGWHVQSTQGFIEDICCIPGFEESTIYALVRRENARGTYRSVERLSPFFRGSDQKQAFFVDSGMSYRGEPRSALSGLDHLEGCSVQILADGYEAPKQVVKDGTIKLDVPASIVHAGLAYISEIEPTRPEIPLQQGSTLTRMRQITGAVIRLYQSMNVLAGVDEKHLYEVITHNAADPINPAFVTGDFKVTIDSGWTTTGNLWKEDTHVLVRATGPTPMTLLSIVYQLHIAPNTGVK